MTDQHGGGHSAHAAGHRGDGLDDRLNLGEHGVARHAALALGGHLVGIPVHGHVNDDLAGTDIILGQALQHACGRHQDVSLAGHFLHVPGLGVAHGNGGVLAQQHHGGGLAHHQRAADHNGLLASAVDAVVVQDLHAGLGGAGREAQLLAHEHTGVGQVSHGVDILAGGQMVADLVLIRLQVLGQGAEQQAAVDAVVGVDGLDLGDQRLLGHILRQQELHHVHADQLGTGGCALLIGQVGEILAAADDGQLRHDTLFLQRRHALLQLLVHGGGHFFTQ